MRIIVVLNPTNKRGTKTEYTNFRKELVKNGFIQQIPDIYMRVCSSRKSCDKYIQKMYEKAPKTGKIIVLKLTEKQYKKRIYITGEPDKQETLVGSNSVIML
ncbi:MAG: CRISPR-associated endonuclease Cas2 [Bacillota bacterium]|nr:CRISPR-associated endonuclease Cas2 [Bacillota bacterium]